MPCEHRRIPITSPAFAQYLVQVVQQSQVIEVRVVGRIVGVRALLEIGVVQVEGLLISAAAYAGHGHRVVRVVSLDHFR